MELEKMVGGGGGRGRNRGEGTRVRRSTGTLGL